MAADENNPPPHASSEDNIDEKSGGVAWIFFWGYLFAPLAIAAFLPLTGNYLIDVLIAAAPMLIAAALILLLIKPALGLIRPFTKQETRLSSILSGAYLIAFLCACVAIGFAAGDYIRDEAVARFGDAQDNARDVQPQ